MWSMKEIIYTYVAFLRVVTSTPMKNFRFEKRLIDLKPFEKSVLHILAKTVGEVAF